MANKKISELNAASTLAGTEVLPVVQSSATVKATVNQVLANLSATNLTSGTVPLARLSGITASQIANATITAAQIAAATITDTEISASANIAWTKISKTGSSLADLATRTTANLTDFPDQSGQSGKYLTTNGTSLSWGTVASGSSRGLFFKEDPTLVAFTKTGNGTAQIKAGTIIDVGGTTVTFTSATSITMPTLTAGTDYAIWVKTDGTIQASSNHSAAPGTGTWRKIGGFHYAPGGNATGTTGGNTTAQINEYSFWDLKFRPACPDPRGMTLVADNVWFDIYLTGVDHQTNGSSKYNVAIADGSSPPKVPSMFGGNGTTTYGSYTWFEAMELAFAFGKKCPTQQEFTAAAYGTTQATSSGGTDVPTTGVTGTGATSAWQVFTSKWGLIQATGCMWIWARDRGGPAAAASWNANTEGRGSEYNAPNAGLLGGAWYNGADSGSRSSSWNNAASASNDSIGSRFSCDHLVID